MQGKMKVTVAILTTLLAGSLGMTAATGKTMLHLVLPADTLMIRTFDDHEAGMELGDRIAARGTLTSAQGAEIGTAHADCVVQRRIGGPQRGLWRCTYVLDLARGDLIVQGLDPWGPGDYDMAVLGGTGAYANASGDATFRDTWHETEMTIRWRN